MTTIQTTIDGWMSTGELTWLAEQARAHTSIVELGCYLGRSTYALAANTSGTVYAVDDFHGPRDATVSDRGNIEERFRKNVYGLPVVIVKANHRGLSPTALPAADFAFIDGSHEYEHVAEDIRLCLAILKPGGLIAGHDHAIPGVARAVAEILGPVEGVESIWHKTIPSR